jgi:hypothetical protein
MRLLAYLELSNKDEKTNLFRASSLKLVKECSNLTSVVVEVCQKHLVPEKEIIELKETLNKELKKSHRGKYIFDFYVGEGVSIEKIKTTKRLRDRLMMKLFEANAQLEQIKFRVEKNILPETS